MGTKRTVTITDGMLRQLRKDAERYGDTRQVRSCDRALAGDERARLQCARVIADTLRVAGLGRQRS